MSTLLQDLIGSGDISELHDLVVATELRAAAENSLIEFTRQAWHIVEPQAELDRKSTRLNSSHSQQSRMPSSA